jgi:hypothetical protein
MRQLINLAIPVVAVIFSCNVFAQSTGREPLQLVSPITEAAKVNKNLSADVREEIKNMNTGVDKSALKKNQDDAAAMVARDAGDQKMPKFFVGSREVVTGSTGMIYKDNNQPVPPNDLAKMVQK